MIAAADIRGSDANNAGLWLELDAILAVVIGGASLMGGRFSILLAIIGALTETIAPPVVLHSWTFPPSITRPMIAFRVNSKAPMSRLLPDTPSPR